jgi:predicted protein tyrosine phosphatase
VDQDYPLNIEVELRQNVVFNDGLALKILNDFAGLKDGCEALLVHCFLGISRSPSVAIALNEVYGLGRNTEDMKTFYSDYNRFVYRPLVENSRKL